MINQFKPTSSSLGHKYDSFKNDDSMLDEMLNDPRFRAILEKKGITREDIIKNFGLVRSCYEDMTTCDNCPGYDKCPKEENPHYMSELTFVGDQLSRITSPCPKQEEKDALNENYLFSDFPSEWKEKKVETLSKSKTVQKVLLPLRKGSSNSFKGLYYVKGEEGSGKSYIVALFCNWASRKGKKIAFIDASRRIDELKNSSIVDKEGFERTFATLVDVDILVIDSFGNEFKTDYIRDKILRPLFQERVRNEKMTIFTSEYSYDDLTEMYAIGKSTAKGNLLQGESFVKIISSAAGPMIEVNKGVDRFIQ